MFLGTLGARRRESEEIFSQKIIRALKIPTGGIQNRFQAQKISKTGPVSYQQHPKIMVDTGVWGVIVDR